MEPFKKIAILTFIAMAFFYVFGASVPLLLGIPMLSGAVIFFGSIIIFGVGLILLGVIYSKMFKLIDNIPTSKIRSIAMGPVEIFGEANGYQSFLKSPFSLSDCVYYKYFIMQYKGKKNNVDKWKILKESDKGTLFYLSDETGSVLIDPKEAKIEIEKDYRFISKSGLDPPEHIKQFLETIDINYKGFLGGNKTIAYTEHLIKPKDEIYIIGNAMDNPYKKDGTAQKGVEDVIIKKGSKENIFYISDKSEKELLQHYSTWKKILYGFGGFITLMSLMVILSSVI